MSPIGSIVSTGVPAFSFPDEFCYRRAEYLSHTKDYLAQFEPKYATIVKSAPDTFKMLLCSSSRSEASRIGFSQQANYRITKFII